MGKPTAGKIVPCTATYGKAKRGQSQKMVRCKLLSAERTSLLLPFPPLTGPCYVAQQLGNNFSPRLLFNFTVQCYYYLQGNYKRLECQGLFAFPDWIFNTQPSDKSQ